MTRTRRRLVAVAFSTSLFALSAALAHQACAHAVVRSAPAGVGTPAVPVAGAFQSPGYPSLLPRAQLLLGEPALYGGLSVQRPAATVAPSAAMQFQAPSAAETARAPAIAHDAAALVVEERAVAAETARENGVLRAESRLSRVSEGVARTLEEAGELSQAPAEAVSGVGERIQSMIAGMRMGRAAGADFEPAVDGGESFRDIRLPTPTAVRESAEEGSAPRGSSEVLPPALAPPGFAARSSWLDRLLHTPRRSAEAYGALVDFWSGLARGALGGEKARQALHELALREYDDAVRLRDADPTFLGMSDLLNHDGEGQVLLDLARGFNLLRVRTGLQKTAEARVFMDVKVDPVEVLKSPDYERPGKTYVYSVGIYQSPGATPTSPALVALDFAFPAYLGLGDAVKKTRLAGMSSFTGLYFVSNLSTLGDVGRLAGDSEQILDKSATDRGLAAVVSLLEASKSPSFTNHSTGFGDVGTSYGFRMSDPASGLTLDPSSARETIRREAAIFGSYIVRRFLREDVARRPAFRSGRRRRLALGMGTVLLSAFLASQLAASLGFLAVAAWKAVAAAAGTGTKISAAFGAAEGALFFNAPVHGDSLDFSLLGAVVGGAFFAALFGGVAMLLGGEPLVGGAALAVAALFGWWGWGNAGDPPTPKPGVSLEAGFNDFEGKDFKARFKAARRAYLTAGFEGGAGRYAARSGQSWHGAGGMKGKDIADIRGALARPSPRDFDILVLLVREIPSRPGQPGVAVIRGEEQLLRTRADETGIIFPSGEAVPYQDVLASAEYFWKWGLM